MVILTQESYSCGSVSRLPCYAWQFTHLNNIKLSGIVLQVHYNFTTSSIEQPISQCWPLSTFNSDVMSKVRNSFKITKPFIHLQKTHTHM